jgi:hypothetical protein
MTLLAHGTLSVVLFDLDDIVVGGADSATAADVRAAPSARRAVHALRAAGLQVLPAHSGRLGSCSSA